MDFCQLWDSFVTEVSSALMRGIWNLMYFFYCISLRLLGLLWVHQNVYHWRTHLLNKFFSVVRPCWRDWIGWIKEVLMFVLAYFVCIKTNLICQPSAYIYCFRVQQVYHSHTGDSVHFLVTFSHYDSGGLIQDLVKRSSENCPPKADPGRPRTRPKGRRTYHPPSPHHSPSLS